jgi:8-amino-7-oxononanoate synthase
MKRDPQLLEASLAELARQDLKRVRRTIDSFAYPDRHVVSVSDGRPLIDFSSNDYLGLARHPEVAAAMADAAREWGAGSGASHLVTGHGIEHARLEEALAEFTGRERALLFSTGYMANLAIVTSLVGRGESVALDRLSHASLIDAALLSGARFRRYPHADAAAAAEDPSTMIATDGVFSMDGDIAPIPDLARTCRANSSWLVVDDAHGLGVVGNTGRGSLEHFSAGVDDVPVLMGTLGKAFGCFGAFVAGDANLIEHLTQKARQYIYTTALPQPVAAAARKALEVAQRESWRRERVLSLASRFRRGMGDDGPQPTTPIQPVVLGSAPAALSAQQKLADAGFRVVAIRPPTVPRSSARLRVTFSAEHSEDQVDALVDVLSRVCAHQDVVPE